LLVLPLVVLALGCGGRLRMAPVSGVVHLDGQPLAGAHVNFQPIGARDRDPGPGSYGKTDGQGRYTLRLVQPDLPGAVVGEHRVSISLRGGEEATRSPDGGVQLVKDRVPARYNTQTTLRFEVPSGGSEEANFDLSSHPDGGTASVPK
jgi:hypothetical protein